MSACQDGDVDCVSALLAAQADVHQARKVSDIQYGVLRTRCPVCDNWLLSSGWSDFSHVGM